MTIIIIPSWYPKNREDIVGSFFREQAIALAHNGNNVYILNGCFVPIQYACTEVCSKVRIQKDEGIHVISKMIPSFGFGRFPHLFVFIFQLRISYLFKVFKKEFPDEHIDIIHAHSSYPAGFVASRIGNELGIPTVITEHRSTFLNAHVKQGQISVLKEAFKGCNKFICVSSNLKKNIEKYVGMNDKLVVLPNMVSDIFEPAKEKQAKADTFIFISVGGLNPGKRHFQLVRCFHCAFKSQDNVRLIIVGEGEERSKVEKYILQNHLEQMITLTGQLSRDDVVKAFQGADAFVLSSAYETFGIVYAEALFCGLPVIATKNGGANDIINNDNGILVNVDNDEELIEAMRKMVKERSNYDSKAIIKDARRRYSEESITKSLYSMYEEVVDKCDKTDMKYS